MRADKVREIAANWGVMWLFWVTSRPKIRVSTFKEGKVFLNIGDKFLLDANPGKGEGDKEKSVSTTKACLLTFCPVILLLDDGRVQLKVPEVQA